MITENRQRQFNTSYTQLENQLLVERVCLAFIPLSSGSGFILIRLSGKLNKLPISNIHTQAHTLACVCVRARAHVF